MKLTENFTISELIYSYTAQVNKIDNRPSVQVIENLKALCENILQPLRDHFACHIIITSGFRSPKLNKKIGGVANSQHIEGKAADFIIPAVDLKTVFKWIKNNLVYDQLLYEYNSKDVWIHVSYDRSHNRKQAIDNYKA